MKIKKGFFFVTFLVVKASLFAQSSEEPSNIYWNENYKLKWSDFLGEPKPVFEGNVAVSDISISFSGPRFDGNKGMVKVITSFDRDLSWSIDTSDIVLQHEQAHFDLEEITARKIRKAISNLATQRKITFEDISRIYDDCAVELDNIQALYDKETEFSNNAKKQAEWIEKITKELKEFEAYSNPKMEIIIK
jgi:hypothetical protein